MKIYGQDVPVDLRTRYDQIVSQAIKGDPDPTVIRARKQPRRTAAARARALGSKADIYRKTAEALARSFGYEQDDDDWPAFVSARLNELLDGTVNTTYWAALASGGSRYKISNATYVPDPNPPAYAYRDPANLPTITTWPAGSLSSSPLNYSGQSDGGYFHDSSWKWLDRWYKLSWPAQEEELDPIVIRWPLVITATCDKRGSRPMFSVIIKVEYGDVQPDIDNDLSAPAKPFTSFFYRYNPPTGVAPYYSATLSRTLLIVPPRRADMVGHQYIRIRYALRPMFGRGNNNNTTVQVSSTGTPVLYQSKATAQAWWKPTFKSGANAIKAFSTSLATSTTYSLGTASAPSIAHGSDVACLDSAGKMAIFRPATLGVHRCPEEGALRWVGPADTYIAWQCAVDPPDPNHPTSDYFAVSGATPDQPSKSWYSASCMRAANPTYAAGSQYGVEALLDGSLVNRYGGTRYGLPFTKAATPPLYWYNAFYVQDYTGQWWKLTTPGWWGNDICHIAEEYAKLTATKLGKPTIRAERPWCCQFGIMIPRGEAPPNDYYLLTWEGRLRKVSAPDCIASDFIGYLS